VRFEALEQTLRLRLVSEPVDKKFFFISRNSLSHTVPLQYVIPTKYLVRPYPGRAIHIRIPVALNLVLEVPGGTKFSTPV
jgi:hypothetical protein